MTVSHVHNDNEKKVSSVNPDMNQIEYQVEFPLLARSRPSSLEIAYLKAALVALHSAQAIV
jgi:hypothetical protein